MKILVTGGIKSGKSNFAEKRTLEQALGIKPLYLATAELIDGETKERAKLHQQRRGNLFTTVEESTEIIKLLSKGSEPVLIECMTMWLNNWLYYNRSDEQIPGVIEKLLAMPRDLVIVINEVGKGVIPDNTLARRFVDLSGRISGQLGAGCDEIWYCVAGHPMRIK